MMKDGREKKQTSDAYPYSIPKEIQNPNGIPKAKAEAEVESNTMYSMPCTPPSEGEGIMPEADI
ncbi:hypothetical protein [Paenibacillus sp. Z6-24]